MLETSGPEGEVIKLLPPLTIDDSALREGIAILDESLADALKA